MTTAVLAQEHNLLKVWTTALCYWARLINLSVLTDSAGDPPAQSKYTQSRVSVWILVLKLFQKFSSMFSCIKV